MFIAHIKSESEIQTCKEHSIQTAEIAAEKLKSINMAGSAYLAGILHDAGKYSDAFLEYIKRAFNGEKVLKGSVIHTFTGCAYILKKFHKGDLDYSDITAEIIAYAIASHHGLFDLISEDGSQGFEHRLNKQPRYDEDAMHNFFMECITENEIKNCFNTAVDEIKEKIDIIIKLSKRNDDETCFYFGLLARLLLSAVIDGDRSDTYFFMSGSKIEKKSVIEWNKYLINLNQYIAKLDCTTTISRARKELSDICLKFAENETDIYQLNIPTGAGKTLSSLRYALKHAARYGKNRIIYVAPLISILEQNVDVIKKAVGDGTIVLEHHSNLIHDEDDEDDGIKGTHKLLMENWDSPIIVTTLVQFLNTLFGGKTSQVRRFVSLANSVIILDEVQTVPWKMLSLFNLAINFLKNVCNATVLLCSATQPSFNDIKHPMNISPLAFLTTDEKKQYDSVFKRSRICIGGRYRLDEVPGFVERILEGTESILVVCNKKKESEYLYQALNHLNCTVFHLSAAMCMSHRKAVLTEMDLVLKPAELMKNKVLCISTQVIEAGVDISFQTVIRLEAGLDSIIQTNGRCNRNGELEDHGNMYIVDCIDENLDKLEEIRIARDATRDLLYEFQNDEEVFQGDLESDKAISYYYHALYNILNGRKGYYDYVVKGIKNINLFSLLSQNIDFRGNKRPKYILNQAFKTAGEHFKPLDDSTISLIVPYGEGKNIIVELSSERAKFDVVYAKKLLDKAKIYSVSVMVAQVNRLVQEGIVYGIYQNSVYAVREEYYDNGTGFTMRKEEDKCNILIL